MSSSSSSDDSSSNDSVLSIHKSSVEFSQCSVSWDPSTTTSDYFPSSFDSMKNRRYRDRYQDNMDRPLDEELDSYWKLNCSDSIGSDRNRRSSFRSDVTGHDPKFDMSAITVYEDSADYPSYSSEKNSMEDSSYREQYNRNVGRSLTDEVDSYQMGIYDAREDPAKQSTFQSGAYEDSPDFSVSGISDVGDRWNMYKDVAQTTWENTKGDMDTGEYIVKKMNEYMDGSQNKKSSRGTQGSSNFSSPKSGSCCCSSKSKKSKSSGSAKGTFDASRSRSPSRGPATGSYDDDEEFDEVGAKLYEKLANHYTEKYLKSSPRKETQDYHQRMGWAGKAQLQRHSTFKMNKTNEEPSFSASMIEGDGDPYANVLPNYEPTMAEMIEPGSYEWADSGIPSDCNLLDTADMIPPAQNRGTYIAPAKGQGTFNVPAKGQGTFDVPAKGQGTFNVPAKGQGTFAVPPKGHGSYAVPVDDTRSRSQGTDGSVDLDSTSLFMEKLANHYTEKYLASSVGAETEAYHRRMGMDESQSRQSTFGRGAKRREADFSLSGIEGNGDPYANVLANCEPTYYEGEDSGSHAHFVSEFPSSFGGAGGGGGGGSYAVPANSGYNYPTSSSRSRSPTTGSDSPVSSCNCTTSTVDPPDRRPIQRHSSFDARSTRVEPDFDLSSIDGYGDPYANQWQGTPTGSDMTNDLSFLFDPDDQCSDISQKLNETSIGSKEYADLIEDLAACVARQKNAGESYVVPPKTGGAYDNSGYNYPTSSSRSRSPTTGSDSPVSSCNCTTSTVDPPDRRPIQKHSSFDARSTRVEPDFDLSSIDGYGDPYANQWQGTPTGSDMTNDLSFLFDPDDQCSEISQKLNETSIGSKEYADLIEDLAACIARQKNPAAADDPNASIRAEMAMLDKDSPEYRQLAELLAEAEGCPCAGAKPATSRRPSQIPRRAPTGATSTASGAHKLRRSAAGTRIPAPIPRGQAAPRGRPPASRIPTTTAAARPQSRPVPGTVTIPPRAKPCPATVTIQPRAKPCPGTVTIQPKGKPVPGTVTILPRTQPQPWPRYDPSTVNLRPTRPRSLAPPTGRTGDVSLRSRAKSAVPTPMGTGCPASRQSRYRPDAYEPQKGQRPRSVESARPRWRGANAPPPATQRPPVVRFVPYQPRSRTTLARQQSGHERSRSEPPVRESTPRHRAGLSPPRITGYDDRVPRPQPRAPLFRSPTDDPNASLREEMAMLDKDSPEYRQLAELLAEAEGCPCDGSKKDDPNASLLEEMAMLDKDSPEYQQLAGLLAEAEGRPSPSPPRSKKPASAEDACAFIQSAMKKIPRDSVQYAKLMVMLMDVQGWDGNARSTSADVSDPCEYIKAEMRNTDRNSTKYIQLEQMLLECEGGDNTPNSSYGSSPGSGRSHFQRAKEDYFRMNPSVDGKRPTGLRKFSEKYPKPDIDFDPYAGGPDYSAFFAGDSPPSNSPLLRTRDAERSELRRGNPIYDPPRAPARAASPEMDERMRFHATSPRRADGMKYEPPPRDREFQQSYVKEDVSLQNPSCYCAKEKEPVFSKTRSLPFDEDLEPRYGR